MYLLDCNSLSSSSVRLLMVSNSKVRLKTKTRAAPMGKPNFLQRNNYENWYNFSLKNSSTNLTVMAPL